MNKTMTMTKHDVAWARKTWQELRNSRFDDGPEVIMLSFGYAEVDRDGDVMAFGQHVGNVAK